MPQQVLGRRSKVRLSLSPSTRADRQYTTRSFRCATSSVSYGPNPCLARASSLSYRAPRYDEPCSR